MTKITEPVNLLETADMEEVKNLSTVNDAEPDSTDLIQVAQIPVIIENLKLVKSEIEKKVNTACEMICTDENYKEIKKLRSSLNKEFAEFETRRKAVKSEIITPYEAFETVYKDCVTNPYKKADSALKGKINATEQELKRIKYEKSMSYFEEYKKSLGIDFVTYEQVNLNITMSVSLKKLKETIKTFLDKVMDDLKLIATQEHKDEILYEYKRSLNVSVAITSVTERYKAIEEEKARAEAEETKEGYNWTQWQAEQLKSLEEYRKHNAKKFGKRFKTINGKVEEMIRTAKADGNASQEAEILEAVKDGFKAPKKPSAHSTAEFFKVNDRKLDALIKSTTDDLKRAETAVLRMSNDKYRKAIFNAQVAMNTGAVTYEKAVDMACKDMLNAGLNCVEYKNGARHTLSDYADMAVKTANKRAYLRGEGEKRAEWGVSLVVVNSRQGGCPDCAKYIGKVFIDDVYSNGKKSDGNYPLLSTAIKNGLFHPRCKDSTSTYYPELDDLDAPLSEDEIKELDRQRGIEEKQQYAQRQAERFDRRAEYSLDEDNKRIAQTRADEWHDRANTLEEKTKQFSLNTNEQKYYRPVFEEDISKTFERKIEGETITIDTHKANTLCDNVYISDKVKLKRKELHNFDMQVRKAFDMLGEVETSGKPEICIVTPEEMRVNAIASYMPMQNVLNVNSAYFSTSDLSGLQENLACPQDGLSTILHELIHWQDAKNYRAKFGSINDYFEYCDYLNKIYAPKVEKLINNGYNIEDISEYAFECLKDKAMDEVYNEYRVSKLLG